MRIVTGAEMAAIDRRAIEEVGIPAAALMETAGLEVAKAAARLLVGDEPATDAGGRIVLGRGGSPRFGKGGRSAPRVIVVAGRGNNGGDGMVAARYLADWGARVRVYAVEEARGSAPDGAGSGGGGARSLAAQQRDILQRLNIDVVPVTASQLNKVKLNVAMADLVIDALLGIGFSGEPEGIAAALIDVMNEADVPVVAVDLPSGVPAGGGPVARAVYAHTTVTFGLPKVGLILYPGAHYTGRLHVVPIGFPRRIVEEGAALWQITPELATQCLPPRPADSHKGTYGHVLVVAGSRGMTGAGRLAVRGAHRIGSGLVTWALPMSLQDSTAPAVPETMTLGVPDGGTGHLGDGAAEFLESSPPRRWNVVVAGPGLGTAADTVAFLRRWLLKVTTPLVLDADGLNALAGWEEGVQARQKDGVPEWILTPHPGEMARLCGLPVADIAADPIGHARRAAERWRAVVVLKGARTVIAAPDGRAWVNVTGNPALAAGGTGDVLAGAIGGLLAQGAAGWEAAVAGVYLHGMAGDMARDTLGSAGVLASEIADRLPCARRAAARGAEGEIGPGARGEGHAPAAGGELGALQGADAGR